jgi:hypothetical protein
LLITIVAGLEVAGSYVLSPAFVAVTTQLPVPLVIVSAPVVPSTVQAVEPAALKLNAPAPLPPPPITVSPLWVYVALAGAVIVTVAWNICTTVTETVEFAVMPLTSLIV